MSTLTLKVKNFLGLKTADLKFDQPLSIIQAENGAGKSSITDGIRYVLGAKVRGTQSKERGRLGLNGDRFKVAFGLNGKTLRGSKSSVPSTNDVAEDLGVSRKAMPYCLNSEQFLAAKPKELKDLFTEVLQLEFDWKKAVKDAGCDGGLVDSLPDNKKRALERAKEERAACKGGRGEPPAEPEDRTVQTRQGPKKASVVPLEVLETAIAQIEEKEEELVGKHATIFDKQVSEEDRAAAKKELESLRGKLSKAPKVDGSLKKLKKIQGDKARAEKKHAELEAKQKAGEDIVKKLQELLDVELCEDCRKKVERRKLMASGKDDAVETKRAKLVQKIAGYQKEQNKLEKKMKSVDTSELKARIAELEPIAKPESTPEEDIQKIKEELGAVQARLKVGRATRDTVRDYQNAVLEYKKALKEHEQAGGDWDRWDKICKQIPEAEKQGVASGIDPLQKAMDKHKILPGKIKISEDLEITYDGRPLELLSKGERYIVTLAPYLATLELFGFPFVLIDDGDYVVTKDLKMKLQRVLQKIAKIKPVLFLQATPTEETAATAKRLKERKVQGVALYQVADQKVERAA